jgi:hypothetical protein
VGEPNTGRQILGDEHLVEEPVDWAMDALRHTDRDVIRAVHVVPGRRPTYEELRHLREHAESVSMSVAGDGSISVRRLPEPGPETNQSSTSSRAERVLKRYRTARLRAVRRVHAPSIGFDGLNEGVR